MRLIDILPDSFLVSPYLMELNIFNANEVKERIAELSMRIHSPKHRKWFQVALFKALVNRDKMVGFTKGWSDEDRFVWMKRQGLKQMRKAPRNAPLWLRTELDKGEPVYKATLSRVWLRHIARIIKWLNNGVNPEKNINMNWESAREKSNVWEHWFHREKEEKAWQSLLKKGTKTIVKYSNGWRWVHLTIPECVDDEGDRMDNCLRGAEDITPGKEYYSLRNEKGKSVITAEAWQDSFHFNNILMKQNEDVSIEYYEYVIDLAYRTGHRLIYSKMREEIDEIALGLGYFNVDADENGHKFVDAKSLIKHTEKMMRTSNGNIWRQTPGRGHWYYYLFDENNPVFPMEVYFHDNKYPCLLFIGDLKLKRKAKPYALDILELSRKIKLPVVAMNNMGFNLQGTSSFVYGDEYKKSLESEIARLKGKKR